MSQKNGASGEGQPVAEWITLGVSVAVVLAVVGLVSYEQFTSGVQPPIIEVRPQMGQVREVEGTYYLPVEVANRGEQTVEDVRIQVSLTSGQGEEVESSQFTIAFLAGNDTERGIVIFEEDPTKGNLAEDIEGFRTP